MAAASWAPGTHNAGLIGGRLDETTFPPIWESVNATIKLPPFMGNGGEEIALFSFPDLHSGKSRSSFWS